MKASECDLLIRSVTPQDYAKVVEIYNHFVCHTTVTFEEHPVNVDDMSERIANVTSKGLPWLVGEQNGVVVGYAYANMWRPRSAYRYAAESSIYLSPDNHGAGYGTLLYSHLIETLVRKDFYTVIGVVGLPNEASEKLHNALGFEKVAHLKGVGYKFNQRLDVGYWQKVLQ